MYERQQILTRTALLLALTLIFQSLRFFIPMPAFLTTWLIGSLVNGCLLVAAEVVGLGPALIIAVVAPIVAYLQQLLFLPVFIVPVAVANCLYVVFFSVIALRWRKRPLGTVLAAIIKAGVLYALFTWLLTLITIPPKIAAALMFAMSWPQLVTALIGGMLAKIVVKRLKQFS